MTKMSDAEVPSLTLEEVLSDGSTLTNPAADHRRLFLGEDGLLHLRDSAGNVTTPSSGLSDPMTTRGDIIIRNASNVTARLGRGTAGQVLTSDGTDIGWDDATAGGSFPLGLAAPDKIPASPGAEDQEFEGTADTLPTADWSWVAEPASWSINSTMPSIMLWERAAGNTTEYKLRIANFAMASTSGLWVKMGMGVPNGAGSQWEWIVYDSSSSNGYGAGVHNGNIWVARDSNAGVLSNRGTYTGERGRYAFIGVMRVSDTWATYYSGDGYDWAMIQSADTRAFTAARLEFRWSSDAGGFSSTWLGRATVDWIRYRADNLFPKP